MEQTVKEWTPKPKPAGKGKKPLSAGSGPGDRASPFHELLAGGRALLGLSLEDLGSRVTASAVVDPDTSYGRSDHLTELYDPASSPARIFFRDRSRSLLVYIGGSSSLGDLTHADVEAELGVPDTVLACRSGKEYAQWVFPGRGVAVATSATDVAFVEIFPPMTLDEYVRTLYDEPGPFVR